VFEAEQKHSGPVPFGALYGGNTRAEALLYAKIRAAEDRGLLRMDYIRDEEAPHDNLIKFTATTEKGQGALLEGLEERVS